MFVGRILESAVALLFGKKSFAVGDEETLITRAGLIYAWVVNLVENPVTERVPDSAVQIQCSTDAAFCAGGPSGLYAGPSGSAAC